MKKQNTTKCCEIHIGIPDNICPDCGGKGAYALPHPKIETMGSFGVCPKCKGTGVIYEKEEKKK